MPHTSPLDKVVVSKAASAPGADHANETHFSHDTHASPLDQG